MTPRRPREVLRAEREPLVPVRAAHLLDHLLAREVRERAGRREQHAVGDAGGAHVERTPQDVGKAREIEHRVGVLGEPGGDDRVAPRRACRVVADLGLRGGQREDDGKRRHRADHRRIEHARA
jgi:hypothetical protein